MPQLSCQNLTLGYEGKRIVSGLSFTVNPGDYLCIIGENGAGKSTLMRAILKLSPPISGQIEMYGGLTNAEIGYLPQQTMVQKDFPASVKEVVRSGCLNRCGLRPFYNKLEKQITENNMELTGISYLAKSCFRELSGGQQQRVLFARALCAAQKMLFLDEPAAGLDPIAASEMYALIKQLNQDGMTIIMISHDIFASLKYASHILYLSRQNLDGPNLDGQRLDEPNLDGLNQSWQYTPFFGTRDAYLESEAGRLYTGFEREPLWEK